MGAAPLAGSHFATHRTGVFDDRPRWACACNAVWTSAMDWTTTSGRESAWVAKTTSVAVIPRGRCHHIEPRQRSPFATPQNEINWYRGGESNPYAFRPRSLSPLRMPFRHPGVRSSPVRPILLGHPEAPARRALRAQGRMTPAVCSSPLTTLGADSPSHSQTRVSQRPVRGSCRGRIRRVRVLRAPTPASRLQADTR